MAQKYKKYDIHCGKCNAFILCYHKYGAGKGILRLYLSNIQGLDTSDYASIKHVPNLQCHACQEVIGTPSISKGQKWAYRMRQGLFHRKLQK